MVPRAKNAVFIERDSQFEFLDYETDSERPPDETGYVAAVYGDSGSPYWIEKTENGEKKKVLVAIHAWGYRPGYESKVSAHSTYKNDALHQCRMGATKITADILEWIEQTVPAKRRKRCTSSFINLGQYSYPKQTKYIIITIYK